MSRERVLNESQLAWIRQCRDTMRELKRKAKLAASYSERKEFRRQMRLVPMVAEQAAALKVSEESIKRARNDWQYVTPAPRIPTAPGDCNAHTQQA